MIKPRKSLGQNFFRDEKVVRRIMDALRLGPDDVVVEIGPGTGALTQHLVDAVRRSIAVEFDRDLVPALTARFGERLELVNRDALDVDLEAILNADAGPGRAKLVANLPYNISTAILQRLIHQRLLFSEMVLMFQREVVDRITAPPGGKERGYLSVLVENAFDHERVMDVAPDAFYPVPKVWSSVVRLVPKTAVSDSEYFERVVSMSFAQKRKTLQNNLKVMTPRALDVLERADIDGIRRAETLTLEEWRRLTDSYAITKKAG